MLPLLSRHWLLGEREPREATTYFYARTCNVDHMANPLNLLDALIHSELCAEDSPSLLIEHIRQDRPITSTKCPASTVKNDV